ncbi:hypothetical protein HXX76_002087 [Chlamydomonas incerta]|uniref:Glycosyltransferase n=1 Tax=Chlamydomonas incerta TaxID=51695 RepID=A0A835WAE6_CHLIN|nr:hypothetical protein HXX76_002087 [Chlamydomonas incerta]|eukprot:KAG2443741.1 hypothetical protein HXX76_002087 [Chlamydomonas incerta]
MATASIDIRHLSCRKSLVLLGMANEEALNHTVPLFLTSLSRVKITGGRHRGRSLDQHLVLVAWSEAAMAACKALNSNFRHKCVRDAEHQAATGSFGFHSEGFNALGFAKIKYILNGLSAGHDVVFLDTDIIVLQDPLPYFLGRGADMWAAQEKCLVWNDTLSLVAIPKELDIDQKKLPPLNIGVLYFKGTPGVTRCVYSWMSDMYFQVEYRSLVWDQDIYGKIMTRCARQSHLRWQVLDPRLFQSACFPKCGCSFTDAAAQEPHMLGQSSKGLSFVGDYECEPQHWLGEGGEGTEAWNKAADTVEQEEDGKDALAVGGQAIGEGSYTGSQPWLLRHFPCSGATATKAKFMTNLLEGVVNHTNAKITRNVKRRRLRERTLAQH